MLLLFLWSACGKKAFADVTFNVANDFSTTSNPNGVWSYGTTGTTPTGPFSFLTSQESGIGGIPACQGWEGTESAFTDLYPIVAKNTSNMVQTAADVVLLPNELVEHPGPSGSYADVRFTAPTNDTYSLSAVFEGRETSPTATTTDVHILLNGVSVFVGDVTGFGPSSDQSFGGSLTLNAGDTLDFAVGFGNNGNFIGDTTGLDVTLTTASAAPEPSTLASASIGAICFALALWRRKRRSTSSSRVGTIRN
jgi:hypothetical protein